MIEFRIITKVYKIFDVTYIKGSNAYKVENENGKHKDTVKEGFVAMHPTDLDNLKKYGTTCDEMPFFKNKADAVQWCDENEYAYVL